MHVSRMAAAMAALGTVAALAAPVPPATAAPAAQPAPAPEKPFTVTLITGDRVTVSGQDVAFEHGPGRAGIRYASRLTDGRRYVIPADAMPLLRQGRLDERLFDVTTLREFGYTGDTELPLLLAYPKTGQRKGPAAARAAVGATGRDLSGVGMLTARASRAERAGLWTSLTRGTRTARALNPGIERVYLDGIRTPSLDVAVPQIGAPAAWQQGLDGTGVTVAVLDSGLDATHPDLAGKIAASENFTTEPSTDDSTGHGTHVASTIAGSGAKSGGKYKGVAPGAKLAIGKVCTPKGCSESAILAGMQWAAPLAPVVNMSLGGPDGDWVDPLEQAVEDLTAAHGTLFVIAAGNDGYGRAGTVDSPASADSALAVGAVDERDQLALFSSRGPRAGDGPIKPDITAPGVDIVAARAVNGTRGEPVDDGYVRMSGTSMATPMVAGAAAILTQQHPDWAPLRKKTLLMGTAKATDIADVFGHGAGRVDLARAVRQTVAVDEGSVNFGRQEWPHGDDTPISRTLTYRNSGPAPLQLALAVEGDTGTFSVTPASLTVPAGGTATATAVADTRNGSTDGYKSGQIVATAPGDLRVGTPVLVNRDVEKYDVTFRHIDRAGQPDENHWGALIRLDQPGTYPVFSGTDQTLNLPKGTYGFYTEFYSAQGTSLLVQPKLVVDAVRTVTLDAREARPVKVTPPRADARQAATFVNLFWSGDIGVAGATSYSYAPGDLFSAQIGPAQRADGFAVMVNSVFARWQNDDLGFQDSPYTYETAYTRQGDFFTGFEKQVTAAELATVKAKYSQDAEGGTGVKSHRPSFGAETGATEPLPFSLPFERTEYVGGDATVRWRGEFEQRVNGRAVSRATGPAQRLAPGQTCRQNWNTPVFAPSLASDQNWETALRSGDTIMADIPMSADGDGHWGDTPKMDTRRTVLYSGGTLIGETGAEYTEFTVPAERAAYRLERTVTRSAPFRLSTSVSGVWTFSSAHGDTALPLSGIRFSPAANAPAGGFTIPVTVERTAGSAAAPNRTLTVDFSTDDGRTWVPAAVGNDRRSARVTNPAGGFVSLRATATDTAGNTATVTVIRAYATS